MDIPQKLQEFLENTGLSMASRPTEIFFFTYNALYITFTHNFCYFSYTYNKTGTKRNGQNGRTSTPPWHASFFNFFQFCLQQSHCYDKWKNGIYHKSIHANKYFECMKGKFDFTNGNATNPPRPYHQTPPIPTNDLKIYIDSKILIIH